MHRIGAFAVSQAATTLDSRLVNACQPSRYRRAVAVMAAAHHVPQFVTRRARHICPMQIEHAYGRLRDPRLRELEMPGQGVRGEDGIKQQRLNAGNHLSVSRGWFEGERPWEM